MLSRGHVTLRGPLLPLVPPSTSCCWWRRGSTELGYEKEKEEGNSNLGTCMWWSPCVHAAIYDDAVTSTRLHVPGVRSAPSD